MQNRDQIRKATDEVMVTAKQAMDNGQFLSAIQLFASAAEKINLTLDVSLRQAKDWETLSHLQSCQATAHDKLGNKQEARELALAGAKSYEEALRRVDSPSAAQLFGQNRSYLNLMIHSYKSNEFELAMEACIKSIAILEQIPNKFAMHEYWRRKAYTLHHQALIHNELRQYQECPCLFNECIKCFEQIPSADRTAEDWHDLFSYHTTIGIFYQRKHNYTLAEQYYFTGLELATHLPTLNDKEFFNMRSVYANCKNMVDQFRTSYKFYDLAMDALTSDEFEQPTNEAAFAEELARLDLQILKKSNTKSAFPVQRWLQFLLLLDMMCERQVFPNDWIKTFFSDRENREQLKERIVKAQEAHAAGTLVGKIGQDHAFEVAVALKLQLHEKKLDEMQPMIKDLQQENETLKQQMKDLLQENQALKQQILTQYGQSFFQPKPNDQPQIGTKRIKIR